MKYNTYFNYLKIFIGGIYNLKIVIDGIKVYIEFGYNQTDITQIVFFNNFKKISIEEKIKLIEQ